MNITETQNYIEQLNAKISDAVKSRDASGYRALQSDLLNAQRELQSLMGGEYALQLPAAAWRPSYPKPIVLNDGFIVWVICPVAASTRPMLCKVILFSSVLSHRVALTNDTLEGLPLFGRGLESCQALEVKNSVWIEEIKLAGAGAALEKSRHFVLCFKDCMVEVIADSISWLDEQRPIEACLEDFQKRSPAVASINGASSASRSLT